MITVGMNYRVLPGKEDVFERAFGSVLEVMKEMEGHAESHLWRDVGEPGQAFIGSEKFRKVVSWGGEQILAGRPTHEVYSRDA
ncbi:MAG: antibiotic biosynthesis monooxygenase family protein [Planctomycetota bacterium]|jgi:heme-degrading monooxygenase HmoA